MLRILYLSAPTALAGAERVILNYLQHHDSSNIAVYVASLLNGQRLQNPFTQAVESMGITLERVPIGNTRFVWQVAQVVKVIKRHGIDILHTHGYRSDITGIIAAKIAGIPIISTVHGWTPVSLKLRAYEVLGRLCLKSFTKILCVSKPLFTELSKTNSRPRKVVCLPNAVTVTDIQEEDRVAARRRLGIPDDTFMLVTVGRLSMEKGFDVLLDAFSRLEIGEKSVQLVFVGDGPLRRELEEYAKQIGIGDRVRFAGFVVDVDHYYAVADLFVMSSHTEGSPMALMEAMACGLPVVATAVGGIPDIVQNGINGCLVPPAEPDALRIAIENVLKEPASALCMGEEARLSILKNFSVTAWAKTLDCIYEEMYSRCSR